MADLLMLRPASFLTYRMRRFAGCLVLLCALGLATLPAAAQNTSDGSIYSRFGLGDLRQYASSQIDAMGGGGTALWSFNYVNLDNPAAWSYQVLTRASAGMRLQSIDATDASDNTSRLTSGSLNTIHFSFPITARQLGLAFAFEPFSRVNYRVQTEGSVVTDPLEDTSTTFQTNFDGEGGLQQIVGGLGYRPNRHLSLGASVNLIFGILEEARRTTFTGSVGFTETNLTQATRLFGVTGTLGALYAREGVLREEDLITVGATFTLPTSLEGDRVNTLGESLNRDTLGTKVEGSVTIPLSTSLGLAYHPSPRWSILVNGRFEPWNNFESDFAFPGYRPDGTSQFNDRLRLSGGFEFTPAAGNQLASYVQRITYRLGTYYDQAYVTPPNTSIDLRTFAVTGGFSLPTMLAGTHLDLNLEVGTRGTTDQQLVRDMFYTLSATLNIGERWFTERKLR